MKIIDLYGYPGSGKTTLAIEFYKRFNGKVYFLNPNDYLKKSNNYSFFLKLVSAFSIKNLKFFLIIRKYINFSNSKEKFMKKLRDIMRLLLLYNLAINKIKKKDIILIIDQGIIQDFTEIFIKYNCNEKFIKEYFSSITKSNILFIRCEYPIKEAIVRVKNRKRKPCAFDKKSTLELQEYMIKLKKLYVQIEEEIVRNNGKIIKYENNIDEIVKNIEEEN